VVALTTGNYKFKVATEDWKSIELGGSAVDETVVLGDARTLVAEGENIVVEVRRPATYSFAINGSTSQSPTLTVTSD
jgi:pullulanase